MNPIKMFSNAMSSFHPTTQVAETLSSGTIGSQVHDLQHFLTAKANPIGKSIQRMGMADGIIALKKGQEGKVYGNQTLAGLYMYGRSPQKVLAMHEINALARNTQGGLTGQIFNKAFKFDGNKLNTNQTKKFLSAASGLDNSAAVLQASAPVAMGGYGYAKAKHEGQSDKKARRAALTGAAAGLGFTAALYVPRKILGGAAELHRGLSADKGYGYGLLEEAAKSANKSMSRPKMFNYSHHMYVTPEENAKGVGRHFTNTVQKALGIKRSVKFDAATNTHEYEHVAPSFMDKLRNKVDAPLKSLGLK